MKFYINPYRIKINDPLPKGAYLSLQKGFYIVNVNSTPYHTCKGIGFQWSFKKQIVYGITFSIEYKRK